MKIHKFTEVLNDAMSYFLLGDLQALRNYQIQNKLPNDLATEFTTNETGDNVVTDGILIPMANVENYPYTILFNMGDDIPELLKEANDLQIRESGYILKIESNELMLFTWRMLNDFNDAKISELREANIRPKIELENGYYNLEILGGQTKQESEIQASNGDIAKSVTFEPTFEFLISKTNVEEVCTADIFRSYKLRSEAY